MLNTAAQGCISGPEPKHHPNGCLVILRTMPFVPEADGLKMALSNCHGFRINCLPQSVPAEGVGTNKDIMASSRLPLHRQKPIQLRGADIPIDNSHLTQHASDLPRAAAWARLVLEVPRYTEVLRLSSQKYFLLFCKGEVQARVCTAPEHLGLHSIHSPSFLYLANCLLTT